MGRGAAAPAPIAASVHAQTGRRAAAGRAARRVHPPSPPTKDDGKGGEIFFAYLILTFFRFFAWPLGIHTVPYVIQKLQGE